MINQVWIPYSTVCKQMHCHTYRQTCEAGGWVLAPFGPCKCGVGICQHLRSHWKPRTTLSSVILCQIVAQYILYMILHVQAVTYSSIFPFTTVTFEDSHGVDLADSSIVIQAIWFEDFTRIGKRPSGSLFTASPEMCSKAFAAGRCLSIFRA